MIVLAGLFLAQGISIWLQWEERARVVSQAHGLRFVDRVAESVRLLEAIDSSQRAAALLTLRQDGVQVALVNPEQVSDRLPRGPIHAFIATRLGSPREIHPAHGPSDTTGQPENPKRAIDLRLQDGQWVRITEKPESDSHPPALPNSLILQLIVTLGIVTVAVMTAVRLTTWPLQQLALAADALGRDLDAPPISETGPNEIRSAARSFNRMQRRIQHLIRERARALAAVSHDLRTPLTRLRLRAELIEDDLLRDQIANDLQSMGSMIDSTLDYLRGQQVSELVRPIDINALLESMVEDARVIGRSISIGGRARTPYSGRLSTLQRAIQNLIDNAIKFGKGAHIVIEDTGAVLSISVQDSGPGIPLADLERVTEPYFRVDGARNAESGGVGLGLSIARDIAFLHGGELELKNREPNGLAATLLLPRG